MPGALSLAVKRPGREADHSPPSSAEVKNAWSYTSTPPNMSSGRGAWLKHRDNFTFTFALFVLNNSMMQNFPEKLIISLLIKKFPPPL
jgi:hypothetical protein